MNLRQDAMAIVDAALAAVDPERLVRRVLAVSDGSINLGSFRPDLSEVRNIYLLAVGKAGATMARGAEAALGNRVSQGLAVIKDGYGVPGLRFTQIIEAAHPLPEERNAAAARRLLELAKRAGEDDLVIFLISGGGSALMTLPAAGISLQDVKQVTETLLKSGAPIEEINAVRKHMTLGAGGRLAAAAAPAQTLSLIVSDVIGDRLDTIASGPTVADESTYAGALDVLRRYDLLEILPDSVIARLEQGVAGTIPETPKHGDAAFARTHNVVLCSNRTAVEAAAAAATAMSYNVVIKDPLTGEARRGPRSLLSWPGRRRTGSNRSHFPHV